MQTTSMGYVIVGKYKTQKAYQMFTACVYIHYKQFIINRYFSKEPAIVLPMCRKYYDEH